MGSRPNQGSCCSLGVPASPVCPGCRPLSQPGWRTFLPWRKGLSPEDRSSLFVFSVASHFPDPFVEEPALPTAGKDSVHPGAKRLTHAGFLGHLTPLHWSMCLSCVSVPLPQSQACDGPPCPAGQLIPPALPQKRPGYCNRLLLQVTF